MMNQTRPDNKPALLSKMRYSVAFAALALAAFISPQTALADCSSPASPAGGLNYVDASTGFQWCDGTDWQDFGGAGGSSIFELASGTVRNTGDHATENFVFGSPQMDDTGNADHDARIIFNKAKGAFRAGRIQGEEWNNTNTGNYSVAFGNTTTASGASSAAWGETNTATNSRSTAFGYQTTASGVNSTSFGYGATAAATASVAVGMQTHVYGTRPTVNSARSMVLFFDGGTSNANSAYNYNLTDSFALIGGQLVIGETQAQGAARGCIRFNATSNILEYSNDCSTYAALGGGGASVFEVTGAAGSEVVRQVAASAPLATSSFVFGSTQMDGTGNADHHSRIFFNKAKAAFRAGYADGTQWNNANVGALSTAFGGGTTASGVASAAFGYETIASGNYSTAFGFGTTASSPDSTAFGTNTTASGIGSTAWGVDTSATANRSTAWGGNNYAEGNYSTAFGEDTTASGSSSVAFGFATMASGDRSTAWGDSTTASGNRSTAWGYLTEATEFYSTAWGRYTSASGSGSTAFGYYAAANGDYSTAFGSRAHANAGSAVAVGLQTQNQATAPQVSGQRSMVLFFDGNTANANSTYNYNLTDSFALIGGQLVIGETQAQGAARGCIRFNATSNILEYSNDCSTYAALGGGASVFEVTGAAGSEVVRQVAASAPFATSSFVFGSMQMDGTGNADHHNRMFFNKAKGAFRAGRADGTQWNNASVGQFSKAFGWNTTASGYASAAWGESTTANTWWSTAWGEGSTASGESSTAFGAFALASGTLSTAFGSGTTASGLGSTAFGQVTTASGLYSTAFGSRAHANAGSAVAVGLQTSTHYTVPQISGQRSMVLFFDGNTANANSTYNYNLTDSFALIGGQLVIGETQAQGAARGCIRFNATSNILEYSNDCSTYAALGGGGASVFELASGTVRNTGAHATENFVFGSPQLADTGNDDHDRRFFFQKAKGAFRAGRVQGSQWDNANVGDKSIALGFNVIASGDNSTALGDNARGYGDNSVAIGDTVTANGFATTALGSRVHANGEYSMAIGLSNQTSTDSNRPKVTGARSLGIFLDNTESYDLTATKTVSLVGGGLIIDPEGLISGGSRVAALQVYADDSDAVTDVLVQGSNWPELQVQSTNANGGWVSVSSNTRKWGMFVQANDFFIEENGSGNRLAILTGGNVGIGTDTPAYKLDIAGNLRVVGSSNTCILGNGSGATNCSSDERLKTNIVKIDGALDKVAQLRGVTFNWKDETKDQDTKVGVIAQDVEKVFPEVVGELDDGTKTVDYAALVAPLIEATKELKAENEALRDALAKNSEDIKALKNHTNFESNKASLGLGFLLGMLGMGCLTGIILITRRKPA